MPFERLIKYGANDYRKLYIYINYVRYWLMGLFHGAI
jgi:hypothetical protein